MWSKVVAALKPDDDSEELLDLVRRALAPGGTLTLVSYIVVSKADDQHQRMQGAREHLEAAAAPFRETGHEVVLEVAPSLPGIGSQLARYAEEVRADLLVIGLIKRSRVGKALLGSDAQAVLMNAPCPVLATRSY